MSDDRNDSLNTQEMSREELLAYIAALEKQGRKERRTIKQLERAVEQERTIASVKASQQAARNLAQRERDRYLGLLLENSKSIILFFNRDGKLMYATDYYVSLFPERVRMKLLGSSYKDTLSGLTGDDEVADALNLTIRASLDDLNPVTHNSVFAICGHGEPHSYQILITPMVEHNVSYGVMLFFHDVTDFERAQEAERAASRAKGDFLSNMSHEMRTPLNAIINLNKIALDAKTDTQRSDALRKSQVAAYSLLGIINDILDMSKIEAKKMELSPTVFDFPELIGEIAGMFEFRFSEKNLGFDCRIDGDIPVSVFGDRQRLAQIITNLLSNAVKFTPDNGRIGLDARLIESGAGRHLIRIDVEDTGIGLSADQLSRLFKPFSQADTSTSRKYGGTGLGLTISKSLTELMGGEFSVRSTQGEGSVFSFTVRLYDPAGGADGAGVAGAAGGAGGAGAAGAASGAGGAGGAAEPGSVRGGDGLAGGAASDAGGAASGGAGGAGDTAADSEWKSRPRPGEFKGRTILLADDIEINREIVTMLLEDSGAEFDQAENGSEAVELFKANPEKYSLIFMDVQMPMMDGFAAASAIRGSGIAGSMNIPIIAMTANVFTDDIEKCLAAGMNEHVGKPIVIDRLLSVMRKYISRE